MHKPFLAPLAFTCLLITRGAFAQEAPPPATPPPPPPATTTMTTTTTTTGPTSTPPDASSSTPPATSTFESRPPEVSPGSEDYRRVSFGAEAQMLVPVGDLSEGSGLLLGPVVRFGYRVARPVELTASAGYLFGLTKDTSTGPLQGNGGLNLVPLMVGARFFFFPDAESERESD